MCVQPSCPKIAVNTDNGRGHKTQSLDCDEMSDVNERAVEVAYSLDEESE